MGIFFQSCKDTGPWFMLFFCELWVYKEVDFSPLWLAEMLWVASSVDCCIRSCCLLFKSFLFSWASLQSLYSRFVTLQNGFLPEQKYSCVPGPVLRFG